MPALRHIVLERLVHGQAAARLGSWAMEAADAVADLPARTGRILAAVTDGRVQVSARIEDLPVTMSRLEGMVDRLTAAVLAFLVRAVSRRARSRPRTRARKKRASKVTARP